MSESKVKVLAASIEILTELAKKEIITSECAHEVIHSTFQKLRNEGTIDDCKFDDLTYFMGSFVTSVSLV